MKAILLIESDVAIQDMWAKYLEALFRSERVKIFSATTLQMARDMFEEHKGHISIIIWGSGIFWEGDVRHETWNGPIQEFRERFGGPVLAASFRDDKSQLMAGCSECVEKARVPLRVLELIGGT